MLAKEVGVPDMMLSDADSQVLPVLADGYFDAVEKHLRPKKDSSAQQRYDAAVKLLIRECAKQNVRVKANIKTRKCPGAFYLFLQTEEMADLYNTLGIIPFVLCIAVSE